jgi:hypothetical protein
MGAALEETQLEAALQLCDPARQRGFGTSGSARGSSESAVTGDEVEICEG